ncbi:MAG: ribosomal RNA small subunit methyltransferase A [Asgard group archaeon]|nr:ribosomal RNA small subunit methyltransferase A [Asgard group archaeon]
MSDLIAQIRDALIEAGISPKKSLSQNFLITSAIIDRQIQYAEVKSSDIVVEIGGGTGVLTTQLAQSAMKVYCIEYDRNLANYLKNKFSSQKNVEIIQGDAMKIDFPSANKFVANLPYHISSPLTFKLLEISFEIAILMYQYEFALRMIAQPGTDDYSRLSANLQYRANVEIMERVSKGHFYPVPTVDSAIVKITPKKETLPVQPMYFETVSRIIFNTKNKFVSTVFYDFFKRIIPKEERLDFRSALNDELSYAKTRARDLTINDLVKTTQEMITILTKRNQLELLIAYE